MVDTKKYKNLILKITQASPDIGKTKLYKLVFFVDYSAFKKHGKTITGDEFLKFPLGPVPRMAWNMIIEMEAERILSVELRTKGNYLFYDFTPRKVPGKKAFKADEAKIIEEVLQSFGDKSSRYLVKESHRVGAWQKAGDGEVMDFRNGKKKRPRTRKAKEISSERFIDRYSSDLDRLGNE